VVSRAGKDDMQKWKFWSYQDFNFNTSIVHIAASRYTDCPTVALFKWYW
jgi:hypothetical protein